MTTKQVACLVPVLNRPHRVRPLVESFHAAGSCDDAELYFIAQLGDDAEVLAILPEVEAGLAQILIVPPADQSWARKINVGYEHTREPWMLLLGDDVSFVPGWIDAFRPYASRGSVIGTNDGWVSVERRDRRWRQKHRGREGRGPAPALMRESSPHPIVSRAYADEHGTADERGKVVHDGYHHNFPDTELCATARVRGAYVYAPEVVVHHHMRTVDKLDDTYRLGQSQWERDSAIYDDRRRKYGL